MVGAPDDARSQPAKGRRVRRAIILIVVLALIAAFVWWAVHLGRSGSRQPGPGGFGGGRGRPATTVGVATVTTADVPITIEGLGTVVPAATVTVTPQVSGVITQILYREGQMVTKGQALAVIDPRPLQIALQQAQGQLARDQAQLTNARLLLERQQTLLAQDSIARQDVDTQAALVRQLEGTVTADQAAVSSARLNLGYSRVIAPVSGRVGLRPIDVGNYVNTGSTTGVAVITQVTPIDIEFTVPQDEVPRLQTQAGRSTLPVLAFDRTRTVQLDQGVFSTLDNRIDTTTGTVRAKARFPNGKGNLFPNQFVNVRLSLEALNDVVIAPVTALRTGSEGDFVWVLAQNHTAQMRKVKRGPITATTAAILEGLKPGEQVITEGGDRLEEGARVQLPGEAPRPRQAGQRRRGQAGAATNAAAPAAGQAPAAPGAGAPAGRP